MNNARWDETWHRLQEWTNGQGQSERLAAQLLRFDGYEGIDPSHPLGGPDGGADILCTKDGRRCLAAVYFPRGQQTFTTIKSKFVSDLRKAEAQLPPVNRFLFVTNQELRLGERKELTDETESHEVEILHLEWITVALDSPEMHSVRSQFLGIEDDSRDGPGGRAGSGYAMGTRSAAIGGDGGRGGEGPGGDGGHGVATGHGAIGIGGTGGDARQPGGQGGRGGRGPTDRFGTASSMWGVGRGGRGGCTPEFIRRSDVLRGICTEYLQRFPQDAPFINAGLEQVPTDWLNQRLVEMGERWRVDGDEAFRTLRSVDE